MTWAEKYRPNSLDEVIGHEAIVRTFRGFLEQRDFPNLMFHGDPGVGKTAIVRAFAKEFYGDHFRNNFKEVNASDTRKIEDVRTTIKTFTQKAANGGFNFRILYLGEFDAMTPAAQDALKAIIEKSSKTVRWIADCNNIELLNPAIQDRLIKMYVGRLSDDHIYKRLYLITTKEDMDIEVDVLKRIVAMSEGSLRSGIEILQLLPKDGEPITEEFLMELSPYPLKIDVVKLVDSLDASNDERKHTVQSLMRKAGINGIRILEIMYDVFIERDEEKLPQVLDCIAIGIDNMTRRCNPYLQIEIVLHRLRQVLGVR